MVDVNQCLSRKQTSGPSKPTGLTCSKPLEIACADLMGPIQLESKDGESYALCMLDAFTEYSAVVLLKK